MRVVPLFAHEAVDEPGGARLVQRPFGPAVSAQHAQRIDRILLAVIEVVVTHHEAIDVHLLDEGLAIGVDDEVGREEYETSAASRRLQRKGK